MKAKTKVALVSPPLLKNSAHHPFLPPLGLTYIAAVLEQDGHEIKIIDCPACNIDHKKLTAELSSFMPNLIGISSITPTIKSALQSARVAKEACPDSKVILGGPHATFMDKQILSQEPTADIVVRGEGEQTMAELAQHFPDSGNLGDIDGITFRNSDGQIVRTHNRTLIQNLDELPRPAYHYIPLTEYRIFGKTHMPIMASRGCQYQCTFCVSSQMFGATFRARSPRNVVDELEWLKNVYGASGVTFHDDTLTSDKKRIHDICDQIINRKLNLPWGCQSRVDHISKEILTKLRKAQCNEVSFGIESGCQKILDAVKKKTSVEQNEQAIRWAKEEGLFVAVTALIGYPGETIDSAKQTIDLLRRAEPDDAWLCVATPYPGTELYALLESMGWKMSADFDLYDTLHPVFENPLLPAEEIYKIRREFYNSLYSPRYVLRQTVRGYLKGNYYSQIMARTALNHMLWRIKSFF
jgi:anaerobic magnesium-protoporphyrin IX monomethyl ester cyclase